MHFLSLCTFFTADKPHVTSHPKDQLNIFPERRVTLSIAARGAAMSYQWLKDGVEITDGDGIVGSATNTLSIASVSKSTEGQYACVVRNIAGEDKSEIAIVKAGRSTKSRCGITDVVILAFGMSNVMILSVSAKS